MTLAQTIDQIEHRLTKGKEEECYGLIKDLLEALGIKRNDLTNQQRHKNKDTKQQYKPDFTIKNDVEDFIGLVEVKAEGSLGNKGDLDEQVTGYFLKRGDTLPIAIGVDRYRLKIWVGLGLESVQIHECTLASLKNSSQLIIIKGVISKALIETGYFKFCEGLDTGPSLDPKKRTELLVTQIDVIKNRFLDELRDQVINQEAPYNNIEPNILSTRVSARRGSSTPEKLAEELSLTLVGYLFLVHLLASKGSLLSSLLQMVRECRSFPDKTLKSELLRYTEAQGNLPSHDDVYLAMDLIENDDVLKFGAYLIHKWDLSKFDEETCCRIYDSQVPKHSLKADKAAELLNGVQLGTTGRIYNVCCGWGSVLISLIRSYSKDSADQGWSFVPEDICKRIEGFDPEPLSIILSRLMIYLCLDELHVSRDRALKSTMMVNLSTTSATQADYFNFVFGHVLFKSRQLGEAKATKKSVGMGNHGAEYTHLAWNIAAPAKSPNIRIRVSKKIVASESSRLYSLVYHALEKSEDGGDFVLTLQKRNDLRIVERSKCGYLTESIYNKYAALPKVSPNQGFCIRDSIELGDRKSMITDNVEEALQVNGAPLLIRKGEDVCPAFIKVQKPYYYKRHFSKNIWSKSAGYPMFRELGPLGSREAIAKQGYSLENSYVVSNQGKSMVLALHGSEFFDHSVRIILVSREVCPLDLLFLSRVAQAPLLNSVDSNIDRGIVSWGTELLRGILYYIPNSESWREPGERLRDCLKRIAYRNTLLSELLTTQLRNYRDGLRIIENKKGKCRLEVSKAHPLEVYLNQLDKIPTDRTSLENLLVPEPESIQLATSLQDVESLKVEAHNLLGQLDKAVGTLIGLTPGEVEFVVSLWSKFGWETPIEVVCRKM